MMATTPSSAPRESPCYATAMRKASRRLTQLYDDALEPCGLRSTQYAIFAELAPRLAEPPTLAELANALVTDRSSLGHTLRPLERDGYVALRAGAEDRRQRRIVLTARGRSKFEEATALWQIAQDRFVAVHGAADGAGLRAVLLGIANDDRLAVLRESDSGSVTKP